MKDSVRTAVFAGVFGVTCALVLTLAGQISAPYRHANEAAEEVRNYLSALGVPFDEKASARSLIELYSRRVHVVTNAAGVLYELLPEAGTGGVVAVAVPIQGMGLWAPIKGVMALEPDLKTIRGLRFYEEEETPGLGGEIATAGFVDQFKGKQMVDSTGKPGFRLVKKGAPLDQNSVDAITGATLTSDRVQAILRRAAEQVAAERAERP